MEKVKITREQEQALNLMIRNVDYNNAYHIKDFISFKGTWLNTLKPLNSISVTEFSLMLNGWYEVVNTYEVGDYLYEHEENVFYIVTSVNKEGTCQIKRVNGKEGFIFSTDSHFEKVTESWKIALLELGRENIELEIGDVYIDDKGESWMIDSEDFLNEYARDDFNEGNVTKYFLHEIGIDLK